MAKIIGDTTATPNPHPDWNQTDEKKADFIKNKPNLVGKSGSGIGAEIFNDYANNIALGDYSHTEGTKTIAVGLGAHAEGAGEIGNQYFINSKRTNTGGYIEYYVFTDGHDWSPLIKDAIFLTNKGIVGQFTSDWVYDSADSGWVTTNLKDDNSSTTLIFPKGAALAEYSHIQGEKNIAFGRVSHAEGYSNIALGAGTHVEGERTIAAGPDAHAQGYYTKSQGLATHTEGINNVAEGSSSHAEGGRYRNQDQTVRGGGPNWAQGLSSHVEGTNSHTGENAAGGHAEGVGTEVLGEAGHAEGIGGEITCIQNIDVDTNGFTAIDTNNKVLTANIMWWNDTPYHGGFVQKGDVLRLEQRGNTSRKYDIRVLTITGAYNQKILQTITFIGELDVDKKYKIISKIVPNSAKGKGSHTEGLGTTASGDYSHVQGKFNIEDTENKYAHIIGNGTKGEYDAANNRFIEHCSNAHTVDWDGNAWYAGSVEATSLILKSPNGSRFNITVDDNGNISATKL